MYRFEELSDIIKTNWNGSIIMEEILCDTWLILENEEHTIISIDTELVYLEDCEVKLKNLTHEQCEQLIKILK